MSETSALRPPRVLIVASAYYPPILSSLLAGAEFALAESSAEVRQVSVPGALEIPPAIRIASSGPARAWRPEGFVALGCVIRGETSHYEIVASESARGLMELGIRNGLAIGNGILTVENASQAHMRADATGKDAGGHAARACLALIGIRRQFGD